MPRGGGSEGGQDAKREIKEKLEEACAKVKYWKKNKAQEATGNNKETGS